MMWTPARGYSSHPSLVSQISWDQYEEEDFQCQMNENGIIGHRESLQEREKAGEVNLESEADLFLDAGSPEPEDCTPSALEDLSCHLSELLDSEPLSQPTEDNCPSPSHNRSELSVSLEDWCDDEQDVTTTNRQQKSDPKYIWLETHDATCNQPEQDWSQISETVRRTNSQSGADEMMYVSSASSRNDRQAQVQSSLPQFQSSNQASNHDTEAHIFSESTDRPRHFSRTYHSRSNTTPLLQSPRKRNSVSQEAHRVLSSVKVKSEDRTSSTSPAPLSTYQHRRTHSHRLSKSSPTDLNDVRKGQLSHTLPDFSQVEPRVRFPKCSYKPPKSRKPRRDRNSSASAPVVFKSPADIVREVLLSSTEGLSDTPNSSETQKTLNSTVPEELRCPLQATNLIQQLQDDYNKLLTKYAEAENTIDRLRLEAKVHLHSDPPKPSEPLRSSVLVDGRKVLTLSFPHAQRAELSTKHSTVQSNQETLTSPIGGSPTHPIVESQNSSRGRGPLTATQLADTVFQQLEGFQLQVDEFGKLLKSGRLVPYEQTQRCFQLLRRQGFIERAYLTAREEYRTGDTSDQFDPDRELEGLIFQSGMRLEELKELVEQTAQDRPSLKPALIRPSPDHQLCVTLNETEPQPKTLISVIQPEPMFELVVTSEESNSNGEEHEEIFPPIFSPLNHKHQCMETNHNQLMDESQKPREFSKMPDKHTPKEDHSSHPEITNEPQWRAEDEQDANHLVQSLPMTDTTSTHSCSSHVSNSMETFLEIPRPAFTFPGQHDRARRATVGGRSQNSSAIGRKDSKESVRVLKASLQDGGKSPETDSGFVGSESSRQTPAVHSPVQQRPAVKVTRPSVTPNKSKINPETVTFSSQASTSFSSHTQPSSDRPRDSAKASGGVPDSLGGNGKAGRRHSHSTFTSSSSSYQLPHQPSAISHLSELQRTRGKPMQASLAHTVHSRSDQEPRPGRNPSSKPPTLSVPHQPGEHAETQACVQLTNQHEAFQSLQAEVDNLKEHLEESLRTASPSKRAPHHTSTPRCHFRSLERNTRPENEEKQRQTTIPRRRSTSVPRLAPQLDITSDSEQSEPITPRLSSHSPTLSLTFRRGRTRMGTGTRPSRHMHENRSSDQSEERNNVDSNRRPFHKCPTRSVRRVKTAHTLRMANSPSHTHACSDRCPLCGSSELGVETVAPSGKQSLAQRSPTKQRGHVYLAVAPVLSVPVVQYVPVCSPVHYYPSPPPSSSFSWSYPKPRYVSPSEKRSHRERDGGYNGHSVNDSLHRAMAAANNMSEVTRRMAHTLATGLQHTGPLAQSCIY